MPRLCLVSLRLPGPVPRWLGATRAGTQARSRRPPANRHGGTSESPESLRRRHTVRTPAAGPAGWAFLGHGYENESISAVSIAMPKAAFEFCNKSSETCAVKSHMLCAGDVHDSLCLRYIAPNSRDAHHPVCCQATQSNLDITRNCPLTKRRE